MTKLSRQIFVLVFLCISLVSAGQGNGNYRLLIKAVDTDSATLVSQFEIPVTYSDRTSCSNAIAQLQETFKTKGFITASIDSLKLDSTFARVVIYLGEKFNWTSLDVSQIDPTVLQAIGWRDKSFINTSMDFSQVKSWQEKILTYMENNGHPFAKVALDSFSMSDAKVSAKLKLEKGPAYVLDSIRVIGDAKISNEFLQRYLEIKNGSSFNREKLQRVGRRIRELGYIEEAAPSKLVWLNTGSILEMYLKPRKSSQVNILVGFLPNSDQSSNKKLLVTGEANLNLKNALGSGETILLNWQQLQAKSPRLNIGYTHPYLFSSPFGIDFKFDMFRKDSTFLNVNLQLGALYILNSSQQGKIFIQRLQTIVNGVNTNYVVQNHRLPNEGDVSTTALGFDYEFNNTNYRLNPTSGYEFRLITTAGTRRIKKNNEILELKDPGDPSVDFAALYDTVKLKTYQFRAVVNASKYLPIGKQARTTVKLAVNGGFLQSQSIFRNELFQIGGYKLLRGFDEESQYLSQYAVGTAEFRYLVGQNSFFYVFTDGGWGRNKSQNVNVNYTYFGTGLGLAFETKVGIFNLAWAVGKRSDLDFNLRQSKIHFGFVNYF